MIFDPVSHANGHGLVSLEGPLCWSQGGPSFLVCPWSKAGFWSCFCL